MQTMIQTLLDLVAHHAGTAYAVIFAVSLGEALFVVGLFVPSTVVLLAAGALVGADRLPLVPVLLLASAGAAAGDALSFWFGHHYRERVRSIWPFSRFQSLMDRGETFFRTHGGKSIFIGRFVPGVKAIVPGIAGMTGMNFGWFTFVNVTSAVVWAAAHIIPAAGIGQGLSRHVSLDPTVVTIGAAVLVAGLGAYLFIRSRAAGSKPALPVKPKMAEADHPF